MDVNEWMSYESSDEGRCTQNIHHSSSRSHTSEDENRTRNRSKDCTSVKAMLHGAIFLATCSAILLLRDVKLPNTSLHYTPLMFSQHIENSSLISLINISQE